jgi:hypothetical protein
MRPVRDTFLSSCVSDDNTINLVEQAELQARLGILFLFQSSSGSGSSLILHLRRQHVFLQTPTIACGWKRNREGRRPDLS